MVSLGLALVLLEVFVPGVYLVWFRTVGICHRNTYHFDFGAIEQSVVFHYFFRRLRRLPAGFVYAKVIKRSTGAENTHTLTTWRASISGKTYLLAKTPCGRPFEAVSAYGMDR